MKLGIFVSCGYCYVDCLVVALVSALSTTQELGQRRGEPVSVARVF